MTLEGPLGLPGVDGIGGGGGSTVRLADLLTEPPGPVQVIVTVFDADCCINGPVLFNGTEFPLVPTHEVALLLEWFIRVYSPWTMVLGAHHTDSVGAVAALATNEKLEAPANKETNKNNL